jgi:hypothetical protein
MNAKNAVIDLRVWSRYPTLMKNSPVLSAEAKIPKGCFPPFPPSLPVLCPPGLQAAAVDSPEAPAAADRGRGQYPEMAAELAAIAMASVVPGL